MAVNKYPWIRNLMGAPKPLIIMGLVQAGSTQEIKRGEICTFNETATYFQPVDAEADKAYSLAIANEEQKAAGLARYMEFMAIRKYDVFEFQLAAARQCVLGDNLKLTASDAQKLTYDADGDGVAHVVGIQNYPEEGTTLGSISYAEVAFNPAFSYFEKNMIPANLQKVLIITDDYAPTLEDCGALICSKGDAGSSTVTMPNGVVPVGWWVDLLVGADQVLVIDPKPDTAQIYIKGAAQAAGKYISMTDIGDFAKLVWDGTDWLASVSLSGADADITVEG